MVNNMKKIPGFIMAQVMFGLPSYQKNLSEDQINFQEKNNDLTNSYGESVSGILSAMYNFIKYSTNLENNPELIANSNIKLLDGLDIVASIDKKQMANELINSTMENYLPRFVGTDIEKFDSEISDLIKDARSRVGKQCDLNDYLIKFENNRNVVSTTYSTPNKNYEVKK